MAPLSPYKMQDEIEALLKKENTYSSLVKERMLQRHRSVPYFTSCGDDTLTILRKLDLPADETGEVVKSTPLSENAASRLKTKVIYTKINRAVIDSLVDNGLPVSNEDATALLNSLGWLRKASNVSEITRTDVPSGPITAVMHTKHSRKTPHTKAVRFYSTSQAAFSVKFTASKGGKLIVGFDKENETAFLQLQLEQAESISECLIVFNSRHRLQFDKVLYQQGDNTPSPAERATSTVSTNDSPAIQLKINPADIQARIAKSLPQIKATLNDNIFKSQLQLGPYPERVKAEWHLTTFYLMSRVPSRRYLTRVETNNNYDEGSYMKHMSMFLYDIRRLHYTEACLLAVGAALLSELGLYTIPDAQDQCSIHKSLIRSLSAFIDDQISVDGVDTTQQIILKVVKTAEMLGYLYELCLTTRNIKAEEAVAQLKNLQSGQKLGTEEITVKSFGYLLTVHFFETADNILSSEKSSKSSVTERTRSLTEHLDISNSESHIDESSTAHVLQTTFTLDLKFLQFVDLEPLMHPNDSSFYWLQNYSLYAEVPNLKLVGALENFKRKHFISVDYKIRERYRLSLALFYATLIGSADSN